jgi:trimethylamine:corrinoid methyltransferase-like protein
MGLLENYTLLYPEKIIFDNEIFYSVKALSEGIQTDFDTASVAIKEIIEVGHEGHFLDRDYTRENIRKLWQQGIANQWSSQTGGFRDPRETAIEKVKWILENHKPKQLDEKIRNEISNIIASAERELVK